MALSVRIGQYVPTHSFLHALDARTKLICALASAIALFSVSEPMELAIGATFTALVLAASRVGILRVLRSVRPLAFLFLILFIFNLFFVQSGDELLRLWMIRISSGGLWAALQYSSRLFMALLVGSMILYTTTPTQLTEGLDKLFGPLAHFGVPAHEIAMVFSLMLRFVPILSDETGAIIDAQALRGGSFTEGRLRDRIQALTSVITALFAAGIRHADNLARALDARSYVAGAPRTQLHPMHFSAADAAAAAITAAFIAAIVAL